MVAVFKSRIVDAGVLDKYLSRHCFKKNAAQHAADYGVLEIGVALKNRQKSIADLVQSRDLLVGFFGICARQIMTRVWQRTSVRARSQATPVFQRQKVRRKFGSKTLSS